MSAQHTPGPWRYWSCKVDSTGAMRDYVQLAAGSLHVARLPLRYVTEADMRLIAAAPDLLEALQYGIDIHTPGRTDGPMHHHMQKWLAMAAAAIAKATGGAA